jgi:hypothetical protein
MKKTWLSAAIVVTSLLSVAFQGWVVNHPGFLAGDFRAFYCAARVASQGADPYLNQPLHSCEVSIGPRDFYEKNPGVTVPAPLPGYAIAFIVPFSLLPFGFAATLWILLLFLAWYVCIATIARFAGAGWQIVVAITTLSLAVKSIPFGEVVPLAIAGICASAYFAWRQRWDVAAIAAAVTMIEPHLGLPVCVALAIWAPSSRRSLAICFAILGLLSIVTVGLPANLEYFTSVLPAHALSEVSRDTQYSLTAVLASLGISDAIAIRAGMLWYAAMIAAGVAVAGTLARKSQNQAFLACVPPAFAVFGGTFIHDTQLVAAMPAIVLTIPLLKGMPRNIAVAALLLMSGPWSMSLSPLAAVAPAFPIGYLAWTYWQENVRITALAAVSTGLIVLGLFAMSQTLPARHVTTAPAMAPIDSRLAEASWSTFTQKSSSHSLASWAARLPTWSGLLLVLVILSSEASRARQGSGSLSYARREPI